MHLILLQLYIFAQPILFINKLFNLWSKFATDNMYVVWDDTTRSRARAFTTNHATKISRPGLCPYSMAILILVDFVTLFFAHLCPVPTPPAFCLILSNNFFHAVYHE